MINNLFVGSGSLPGGGVAHDEPAHQLARAVNEASFDYRLTASSPRDQCGYGAG